MQVKEVIKQIKSYCKGITEYGKKVDDNHDKILYDGGLNQTCTGIVTAVFCSIDVIQYAIKTHANLIISHEGMFWNHGDETNWLQDNQVYQKKKELLDQYGISVWRNFEYIISGIPKEHGYVDGIAYGFVKEMGWESNLNPKHLLNGCHGFYLSFNFPDDIRVEELAKHCIAKLGLQGVTIVGDPHKQVKKLYFYRHQFLGYIDHQIIKELEDDDVDCAICGEMIDSSVSAYVRDSNMIGKSRAIIKVGNFNICECGMKYAASWIPNALSEEVTVTYCATADSVSLYL